MKKLILIMLLIPTLGYSQRKVSEIKSSPQCGMCVERIEKKLNYTKGIVWSKVNLETSTITVKYKTKKIDLTQVKETISNIGYDADEIQANKDVMMELPHCCQKPKQR
jgi:copper chaperone CopZ